MANLREYVNGKKRNVMFIAFVGSALCFVGILFGPDDSSPPWAFLSGMVVVIGSMAYGYATIRCPSCKTRIGSFAMSGGTPFSIPKNMKHCPSCGVKFEAREMRKA